MTRKLIVLVLISTSLSGSIPLSTAAEESTWPGSDGRASPVFGVTLPQAIATGNSSALRMRRAITMISAASSQTTSQ